MHFGGHTWFLRSPWLCVTVSSFSALLKYQIIELPLRSISLLTERHHKNITKSCPSFFVFHTYYNFDFVAEDGRNLQSRVLHDVAGARSFHLINLSGLGCSKGGYKTNHASVIHLSNNWGLETFIQTRVLLGSGSSILVVNVIGMYEATRTPFCVQNVSGVFMRSVLVWESISLSIT